MVGVELQFVQRVQFMRRNWPAMLVLIFSIPSFAATTGTDIHSTTRTRRQARFASTLTRAAEFVDVLHVSSGPTCVEVQPPQALATPDPMLLSSANVQKVKVSFIIGTDGHVRSPLILESAGAAGDRRVIDTVRRWRYRPATCNGVPTEIEGKIEFSSR